MVAPPAADNLSSFFHPRPTVYTNYSPQHIACNIMDVTSIVVVTQNQLEYTRLCLASISACTPVTGHFKTSHSKGRIAAARIEPMRRCWADEDAKTRPPTIELVAFKTPTIIKAICKVAFERWTSEFSLSHIATQLIIKRVNDSVG